MLEQKFFKIVAEGEFTPDQIDVVVRSNTLLRTPESERFIEGKWQAHLATGVKPWPNDLKPTRYRVAGLEVVGNRLQITLDPCVSYKDFVGSLAPEFEQKFGYASVPNPLAVMIIITTLDNKMLVTLRNQETDYKPGGYHVSLGGFMDAHKEKSPYEAVLRETEEETGIKSSELSDIVCFGAMYNPWTFLTGLIFQAKTSLTAKEILARVHDDENELLFVPTSQRSIEYWITEAMHANVIAPMAGLILAYQKMFGSDWRARMLDKLAIGSKNYDSEVVRKALEERDIARLRQMVAEVQLLKEKDNVFVHSSST